MIVKMVVKMVKMGEKMVKWWRNDNENGGENGSRW